MDHGETYKNGNKIKNLKINLLILKLFLFLLFDLILELEVFNSELNFNKK